MAKGIKLLLLITTGLFLMAIYNVSGLHIPPNERYEKSNQYMVDSGQLYNLPGFSGNNPGSGALSSNNEVIVIDDTVSSFETMLALMESATTSINIETFILRDDAVGQRLKETLIRKAGQGVTVRIIYDAWGSFFTSGKFMRDLENQGVRVVAFNPLAKAAFQGRLDNRMHSKIIVIDGTQAIIGGQNFGNEYLGMDPKIGSWKGVNALFKGSAVSSLQQVFFKDWLLACGEKVMDKNEYPLPSDASNRVVSVVWGGPDSRSSNINNLYCGLANAATNTLHIETPYFLPDNELLESLEKASQRGVEVHLIIPAHSDNRIDELARLDYLEKLLQEGIKVSTYNHGYLHAKLIVVDASIAVVGSANFDKRSGAKNYESDAVIYDGEIAGQLDDVFLNDLEYSSSLTSESLKCGFFQRGWRKAAAILLNIV
ncbi:MAG: phospholipase D-like domain-containing protein [Syntrophomonas sp.]